MPDSDRKSVRTRYLLRDLKAAGETRFSLEPGPDIVAGLAADRALEKLRKLRFEGVIRPEGAEDWRLQANLGATLVQACIVSGEPVTTRLDIPVERHFLAHWPEIGGAGEVEFDGDDSAEPLGDDIDLLAILGESLALEVPEYPRKSDAELGEAVFTAPGLAPMTDDDAKPLAGLAALRDKMAE